MEGRRCSEAAKTVARSRNRRAIRELVRPLPAPFDVGTSRGRGGQGRGEVRGASSAGAVAGGRSSGGEMEGKDELSGRENKPGERKRNFWTKIYKILHILNTLINLY